MRTRICKFLALFFALAMINTAKVKADEREKSNNQDCNKSTNNKDSKDHTRDKKLPINTAIGALLVAGAGIGIIAINRAKAVKKAI